MNPFYQKKKSDRISEFVIHFLYLCANNINTVPSWKHKIGIECQSIGKYMCIFNFQNKQIESVQFVHPS